VELIKQDININFAAKLKPAGVLSLVLIIISVGSLLVKGGPKYGIDFAGGTLIQVQFSQATTPAELRGLLARIGQAEASVQPFGDSEDNEYLISIQATVDDLEGLSGQISQTFSEHFSAGSFEIRRVEMVGPKVGRDLRQKGFLAVICSLMGMLVYIWWRFELRFGVCAVIALAHDVIITLGALSLTNTPIDLPVIAALLTVVGYSVNDTIIVCDRIRENMRKMLRDKLSVIINNSVNATLNRTIITSGTTLMVVAALFLFGGGIIHDFAFILLIGILVGTYSSIFIASPTLLVWEHLVHNRQRPKGPVKKAS
jgi:preprotein translocase subunit SecF